MVSFMVDVSSPSVAGDICDLPHGIAKTRPPSGLSDFKRRSRHFTAPDTELFSPSTNTKSTSPTTTHSPMRIGTEKWEVELKQHNVKSKYVVDLLHDCIQTMSHGHFIDFNKL